MFWLVGNFPGPSFSTGGKNPRFSTFRASKCPETRVGDNKEGKEWQQFLCLCRFPSLPLGEKRGEILFTLEKYSRAGWGKGAGAEKGVGRKTPFGYSGKWKLALVWSQTAFRNVSGKREKERERRRQNLYRPPPPAAGDDGS